MIPIFLASDTVTFKETAAPRVAAATAARTTAARPVLGLDAGVSIRSSGAAA